MYLFFRLVEIFKQIRRMARTAAGESYIQYRLGKATYNVIDARNAEFILNHPNLTTKGFVYNFLHPFLKTGVLTSNGNTVFYTNISFNHKILIYCRM